MKGTFSNGPAVPVSVDQVLETCRRVALDFTREAPLVAFHFGRDALALFKKHPASTRPEMAAIQVRTNDMTPPRFWAVVRRDVSGKEYFAEHGIVVTPMGGSKP